MTEPMSRSRARTLVAMGVAVLLFATGYVALRQYATRLESARQRRTCSSLVTVLSQIAEYRESKGAPPAPHGTQSDLSVIGDALSSQLRSSVEPNDAWGRPLLYWSDGKSVMVGSLGADGKPDYALSLEVASLGAMSEERFDGFDGDLVLAEGPVYGHRCMSWPRGVGCW